MATYIGYSTIGQLLGSKTLVDKDIAVRDLLNHFYTRKGERVMNPDFGCAIWDLLFDPLDFSTETLAKEEVERIVNSDPRWALQNILMTKPDDHSLNIRVSVIYDSTGTAEELYLNFVGEIE